MSYIFKLRNIKTFKRRVFRMLATIKSLTIRPKGIILKVQVEKEDLPGDNTLLLYSEQGLATIDGVNFGMEVKDTNIKFDGAFMTIDITSYDEINKLITSALNNEKINIEFPDLQQDDE